MMYEYRLTRDIRINGVWDTIVTGGPSDTLDQEFFDQAATLVKWAREGDKDIANVRLEKRILPDPELGWEEVTSG